MKFLFPSLCWAVLWSGILIACTQKPKPSAPAVEKVHGQEVAKADVGRAAEVPKHNPYEEIASFDPDRPSWTVYFDFDSYALKETARASEVVDYLRTHPGGLIHLTGHTCPRGTNAYNMALGARRAQTLRTYLEAAGIPESRIRWISYGEERLVTKDPNQWYLNRRCEITLEESK